MTTTDGNAPQQMPQMPLLTLAAMVVGAGMFSLRSSRRPPGCSARWSPG